MADELDGTIDVSAPRIAGVSALKGLVLYTATLSFAGLYIYFIVKISSAQGSAPHLDSVLVSAAAALAGVLGSAFALEVGLTTPPSGTNQPLARALAAVAPKQPGAALRVRQGLSFEAVSTSTASWPKTFGIWVYAIVAAAVAITYALNQDQTPAMIKALAVAFAGYVLALITAAYGSGGGAAQSPPAPQPAAAPADAVAEVAIAPNGGDPAKDEAHPDGVKAAATLSAESD